MIYSRVGAVVCTVLLIGLVAGVTIGLLGGFGPILAHGQQVEHISGILQSSKTPQEVVVMTAGGQQMRFQCQERCLKQLAHIQRHINEHANTDIYYKRGPGNTLIAIDVD